MISDSQRSFRQVKGHLDKSKFIWVDQRSLGLNGVDVDTLETVICKQKKFNAIIRKSSKLEGCYFQISHKIKQE